MTNSAIKRTSEPQEKLALSGYGFRMVINGHDKPQIFNDKGEPVIDVKERMDAYQKLALPLMQKLGAFWQQELVAATQIVTAPSDNVTQAFVANDNVPKKRERGDKVEDGSYYMGISPTTGTDFFLFIESVGINKHVDVLNFFQGTEFMRQQHEQGAEFHGHKFSAQQLENEIVTAQNDGTEDGGIRRLTRAELWCVEDVFKIRPELRQAALEVYKGQHFYKAQRWIQSATPFPYDKVEHIKNHDWGCFFNLNCGNDTPGNCEFNAFILGGRSLPRLKS